MSSRTMILAAMLTSMLVASPGCLGARLRDRLRANEGSFSEAPSLPKADFGREKSELKSTGSDRRAREIEESLGVGG